MNFSNLHRSQFVAQLSAETFDLLVIGGGITGCGIALDAALRGMKVALIEKNDFASGTSSRSTKLIHGGLRYLKQLEFALVYEVGREREIVHRNARHLVIPEKMLLPIVEGGSLGEYSASLGLWVYDLLAGVKREERRKMLDKHETLKAEPLLDNGKLLGGGLYVEYRTDDSRLVIELAKSAFANGGLLLNYAECKGFTYDEQGKITGAKVLDRTNNSSFEIKANTVVNASGPWVDLLRKEDNSLKGKRLLLTKGVHLVFPHKKLPVHNAVYFDAGDGRMVFVIPRDNITYAGTTDTVYNQDINNPRCNREDAMYVLDVVNRMFPSLRLQMPDIESSWAGLRPLIFEEGKSASEVSRKDEIMISSSGLISIAGGKLTGYRLMAKKIVDLAAKRSKKKLKGCKTKNYRLSGGDFSSDEEVKNYLRKYHSETTIPGNKQYEWLHRYGKNMDLVVANVKLLEREITDKHKLFEAAELLYGIEHELVYHPLDFLIRRTGKIFFHRPQAEKEIDFVTEFLSKKLGRNSEANAQMLKETKAEFAAAVMFW